MLGSSRVSSQKQNHKGVVGAQSGQYRATVESSPGCCGGPSRDVTHGASVFQNTICKFDTNDLGWHYFQMHQCIKGLYYYNRDFYIGNVLLFSGCLVAIEVCPI